MEEIDQVVTGEGGEKRAKYSINNYKPYNKAVDNTLEHHASLAAYIKDKAAFERAQKWAVLVGILCFIALTAVISYWILRQPPIKIVFTKTPDTSQELSSIEKNAPKPKFGIATHFTVFDETKTEYGEFVITAKEFRRPDFETPYYQYCYITPSKSVGSPQTELAIVDQGVLIETTTDEYLLKEALLFLLP